MAPPAAPPAGAVVQFPLPDGSVVPTDQSVGQPTTAAVAGTGGNAPVVENVPTGQLVSATTSWITQTDSTAMQIVNQESSTSSSGLSGGLTSIGINRGVTPAGLAILNGQYIPGFGLPGAELKAAAAAAMSNEFLPAPAAPMTSANYGMMAWNALHPLIQLITPLGEARTAASLSGIQGLMGVQLPQAESYNSGDAFVNWVDQVLYNGGQPLTAGSVPLYGTYWLGGEGVTPSRRCRRRRRMCRRACRSWRGCGWWVRPRWRRGWRREVPMPSRRC